MLGVSACSMSGPVDSYCLTSRPIILSKKTITAMDTDEVTSILAVNEYYKTRCM